MRGREMCCQCQVDVVNGVVLLLVLFLLNGECNVSPFKSPNIRHEKFLCSEAFEKSFIFHERRCFSSASENLV